MSAKTFMQRIDGWVNTLTDLGHSTRDKSMAVTFQAGGVLSPSECEDLYHHDDLANRIVSAVPDEALRQGVEILSVDEDDQDRAKEIEKRLRALGAVDKVHDAMLWGRCKGGAALLLLVEGAGLPQDELDDNRIKRLLELRFIDRDELTVFAKYTDLLEPRYGQPSHYLIQPRGGVGFVVHETRLIMFGGAHTSSREREKNGGWDHSVLQRVIGALRGANTNWQSVVHMMNDFSQAVFKISGLIDAIENNRGDTISMRMALMDKVRAVSKALILDAGDPENNIPAEEFQVVERGALTGVDSIIQQTWLRLATAARMPVSILMGQAPAGLNATGAIDLRWWYDTVRTSQEHEVKPPMARIVGLISMELFRDSDPDSWVVSFPSLWQMTPSEEAELRGKIAASDAIYIDKMVALPEEIAISRWGKGRYSTEMVIDIDARRSMLESESADIVASDIEQAQPAQPAQPAQAEAEEPAAGIVPGTEKDPSAALNGAQVASLLQIVTQVALRQLPRDSGIAIMMVAFPITKEQAEAVMGSVGNTFFAEAANGEPETPESTDEKDPVEESPPASDRERPSDGPADISKAGGPDTESDPKRV